MKNEKITISDIAEVLGVSSITVSRALSGHTGVGEDLRVKILDKAREMGYVKIKNSTINILVLHQRPYVQDNTNFSHMVQGIEKSIQSTGADYSVEFIDKEKQEKMQLPYQISKGNSFDGVIFIGGFNNKYLSFIKGRIKNQLLYTGYSPSYDCDSVWFNFNNSAYKQCEYLIKKGHTRIGFIGSNLRHKNKEKILGITAALEDYNLSINEEFFLDKDTDLETRVPELMAMKDRPTAIICSIDFTAIKLIKLLHNQGIKVPEDISVVGSGNSEMSSLTIPSLTTMDLNIEYSCEKAVSLLISRINNPDKPYECITVNSNLIERESVSTL